MPEKEKKNIKDKEKEFKEKEKELASDLKAGLQR